MTAAVTHIAAPDVEANGRLRQRCAWCGALLFDYDLARVAVLGGGAGPSTWGPMTFVRVDGGFSSALPFDAHPEAEGRIKIPDDSCINIDPLVTA